MKFFSFLALLLIAPYLMAQKPSPDEALILLKEGNNRFLKGELTHPHLNKKRLELAGTKDQGDYAYATIISCSDSRVPVEYIFDTGIMDIFVIRVAGNVCDTDEVGSIEYGLAHVNTPILVVLGHTQCGAVTAVASEYEGQKQKLEKNILPLIDNIKPAVKRAHKKNPKLHGKDLIPYAIEENVWQSIEDLFTKSPDTRSLIKSKKVKVIGAIYNVATGKVNWLDEEFVDTILKKVEKKI